MSAVAGIRRLGEAAFLVGTAGLGWIGVGLIHLLTGRDVGAGLQPSYVAFAVAGICAFAAEPEFRRRLTDGRFLAPLWWLALAALLLSALGLRAAPSGVPMAEALARWGRQVVQWAVMAAVALITAHRLDQPAARRPFALALAAGVLLQGVYAALQTWQFADPRPWFLALERVATSNPAILSGSEELYLGHAFTGIPRVRGTACEPLYLGNLLLMSLPFLMLPGTGRRLAWGAAATGLVLLLATWSRGAWLGGVAAAVTAGGLAWSAGHRPGRRLLGAVGAALVLAAAGLALLAGPQALTLLVDRLRQSLVMEDWSNLTRLYSMHAAWKAFLLSPWVGIGWGQFGYHFPLLTTPEGLQSQFDWPVVNNYPLQVLAETGLAGFLVLAAGAGAAARRLLRACRTDADPWRVAAAAAAVGVGVQLLSFSQYNLPHIWVAVGALLAAAAPRHGEAT
ncbi:MAG TPA: O-antigen ligase family protein [Candidatus Krumholzibacteria bacterium]|nr:O-antigen ligase family protein [Candidatus Krumholzibacteria bacterium]HRX50418.1 O-antigen ligase family protein [Candidatus Krumholzibacteria bacterium]